MTKTSAIPANRNVGIWIDHRKATIVRFTPDGTRINSILSNAEKHSEREGDSPMKGSFEAQQVPADDRRQRRLTGQLKAYYETVIEAVRGCDRIYVFGPGEAKGELQSKLLANRQIKRIVAIESADKMTDRQIAAKARAHFLTGACSTPIM